MVFQDEGRTRAKKVRVEIDGPILPQCTGLSNYFAKTSDYYTEDLYHTYKRYQVLERDEYFVKPKKEVRRTKGEERLKTFETILEHGYGPKWRRELFQKEFHEVTTRAMFENLLGDDFERVGPQIIRERFWEFVAKVALGKAPRRFGKSVAVGMDVIAYGEVMPDSVQSIFSTGRRASKHLLDIAYKLAIERGLGHRICKFNEENLWFRNDDDETNVEDGNSVSKIFSYPANARIGQNSPPEIAFVFLSHLTPISLSLSLFSLTFVP